MYQIYVWPCGTWCEDDELEEYLTFKSDDYRTITVYENDDPEVIAACAIH